MDFGIRPPVFAVRGMGEVYSPRPAGAVENIAPVCHNQSMEAKIWQQ